MFRDVPECSGMFHVLGFIDALTKHTFFCPTLQTRTCIGVLKSIIMFFHSFIAMEYAFTLFFAVNSSINAAGDHLAGGSFLEKH